MFSSGTSDLPSYVKQFLAKVVTHYGKQFPAKVVAHNGNGMHVQQTVDRFASKNNFCHRNTMITGSVLMHIM